MKVAITGATGFIGGRLSLHLRGGGHEVIALVRSPDSAAALADQGISTVRADVSDPASLREGLRGADVVMHLAALFNRPEASWEDYRRVNVDGVRNVLEAARDCGAARVVHCSTVGVATGRGHPPFSETTPYSPPAWDKYETTKCEGEKEALEFHRRTGFPVVVLRPAQVYGPGDRSKAKFYRMVKRGVIVSPGRTLKHLVYIDDVCRAFELAAETDAAVGQVFIIAGREPIPLRDLIALVAQELGVPAPKVVLPALPMTLLCTVTEAACNLARVKPVLFRRSMDFFTKSVQFDVSRARDILAFEQEVEVPAGVARTAAWYQETGLI